MVAPVLKWAGGKRQLLSHILRLVPEHFDTYIEPFFGGGALYFKLYSEGKTGNSVISDSNPDLYNLYRAIKTDPEGLIHALSSLGYGNAEPDYYRARDEFNSLEGVSLDTRRAALLIYLNRHCYNGLYRVNSSGRFNVPFGRYRNPSLPSPEHIREVSESFHSTLIVNSDFENTVQQAKEGDFVYMDPPYEPLSRTSSFTAYGADGFGQEEQERLAAAVRKLSDRGVSFLLSNSYTDRIVELYDGFNKSIIEAKRNINSVSSGRGRIRELLIRNF